MVNIQLTTRDRKERDFNKSTPLGKTVKFCNATSQNYNCLAHNLEKQKVDKRSKTYSNAHFDSRNHSTLRVNGRKSISLTDLMKNQISNQPSPSVTTSTSSTRCKSEGNKRKLKSEVVHQKSVDFSSKRTKIGLTQNQNTKSYTNSCTHNSLKDSMFRPINVKEPEISQESVPSESRDIWKFGPLKGLPRSNVYKTLQNSVNTRISSPVRTESPVKTIPQTQHRSWKPHERLKPPVRMNSKVPMSAPDFRTMKGCSPYWERKSDDVDLENIMENVFKLGEHYRSASLVLNSGILHGALKETPCFNVEEAPPNQIAVSQVQSYRRFPNVVKLCNGPVSNKFKCEGDFNN